MNINFRVSAARIADFAGWPGVLLLAGCGSSGRSGDWASGWARGAFVGQTLALSDGTPLRTVGDADGAHRFADGSVESGVWVDGSPRIAGQRDGMPPRSAARVTKGSAGGVAVSKSAQGKLFNHPPRRHPAQKPQKGTNSLEALVKDEASSSFYLCPFVV